jgi:hypothetical protein
MRIHLKRDFSAKNISFKIGIFSIKPGIPPPSKWTFLDNDENVAKMATCTQHVPEMSKMGVGQNTFETRKTCIL